MKSVGPNLNSIWNMVAETTGEADWLEKAQHALTCHEFERCPLCREMRESGFDINQYQGKATLIEGPARTLRRAPGVSTVAELAHHAYPTAGEPYPHGVDDQEFFHPTRCEVDGEPTSWERCSTGCPHHLAGSCHTRAMLQPDPWVVACG